MTILEFIAANGGSQDSAAKKLGLSQAFLSRLVTGKRRLSVARAREFDREHGLDAWRLVDSSVADLLKPKPSPADTAA